MDVQLQQALDALPEEEGDLPEEPHVASPAALHGTGLSASAHCHCSPWLVLRYVAIRMHLALDSIRLDSIRPGRMLSWGPF